MAKYVETCENCGTEVEDLGTVNMMCHECGHIWLAGARLRYIEDEEDYGTWD